MREEQENAPLVAHSPHSSYSSATSGTTENVVDSTTMETPASLVRGDSDVMSMDVAVVAEEESHRAALLDNGDGDGAGDHSSSGYDSGSNALLRDMGWMRRMWLTRIWGTGKDHDGEKYGGALWRNVVAFFICGLLNNYSYVVMLSAAEDMLEGYTGIVLLFDILPSLLIKITAPFFMHVIPYNLRVAVVAIFAIGSFQFVGWFDFIGLKLFGVILASASSGLGEITFLAMSSYYHKDVISSWSSGTGGAGIFGALSYLALTAWFGLTDFQTLMAITVAPFFLFFAVFVLMSGNHSRDGFCSNQRKKPKEKEKKLEMTPDLEMPKSDGKKSASDLTFKDKLMHILPLLKYMIPLFVVYYSEYLINQGVAPTITFKRGPIKGKQAYVYYQFLYQTGVFISRSSVKFVHIRRVWIPAALQCVNLVFLFADAYFRIIPSIFIVFVIIVWEGLLGGAAYVNSFYNISIEVQPEYKEFSLGVTSVADTMGITFSGLTSSFLQSFLLAIQHKKPI